MIEPALNPESGFRRLRIDIAYDGTNFYGWGAQPDRRTLQDLVEEAISRISRIDTESIVAGRTDAGVHGRAQVAHLRITSKLPVERLLLALNRHLPDDVRIINLEEMPAKFHDQLDVNAKTYRYFVLHSLDQKQQVNWPFLRNYTWYVSYPLDLDKMRHALGQLVGIHDFKSFQNRGTPLPSTVREILAVELTSHRFGQSAFPWLPPPELNCELLEFRLRGTGFLKQMVRTIVGTVVEIGRGKLAPEAMGDILAQKNREASGITAPANGLFLDQVEY